jgi:polar amino acid transport system substrate-binding protein
MLCATMHVEPPIIREFSASGRLRAALNMGNPVLAHSRTASERPAGVTVDLARRFAALLGVEVDLLEFESAAASGAAVAAGQADVGFLAIDPKRAEGLHFTSPYVQIEGCYLVRDESPLRDNAQVDRAGTRVVVGDGSAYQLFLSRELKHATVVKVPTSEGVVDAFLRDEGAQVAAGVRQQLEADAQRVAGVRLLPGRFMVIEQAMAMPLGRSAQAAQLLESFIAQQRRSGFVRAALQRHGIEGATPLP